ncbi:MAG: hypothetical protein FJ255_10235 [Phycisphaerae bacterium]|nr:hypothetical protein [Phycisphaerae bacterium]
MNARTRMIVGALAAGALTGCTTSYQVDVRNHTPQPVVVAIFQATGGGQQLAISPGKRIGPGDRDALATRAVPQDWVVFVQADTPGNPGHPARLDLAPGLTAVDVTQEGAGQTGPLRLRTAPRP